MESHYKILGLMPNASVEEIKKVYRARAKFLHPDKNKEPGSSEKFIELTEAYHHLINLKAKPINQTAKWNRNKIKKEPKDSREEWRKKARKAAQMEYEEWLKSEEFEMENATSIFWQFMLVIGVGLMILFLCIYFITNKGAGSILLFLIILGPFYFYLLKNVETLKIEHLMTSVKIVSKNTTVLGIIVTAINSIIFMRIGFQTMIPIHILLIIYFLTSIGVFIYILKKRTITKWLICACYVPLGINLLLVLNYFLSFNPVKETYPFSRTYQTVADRYTYKTTTQVTTLVILENNKYKNYAGIRVFADKDKIFYNYNIEYTFKTGIFGIRVMTDYRFF